MIHQLIFANPRPGMSPGEFQDYWISVHARDYASKIPQIKKYKVSRILPMDDAPVFHGMAEIWLENETEQLASLQTPEFVEGARADEPKWAAFWESLCLDTTAVPIVEAGDIYRHKLVFLVKRKGGIPLPVFRKYALDTIGRSIRGLESAKAACLCIVKDGFYSLGESRFDAAYQIWFEDAAAVQSILSERQYADFRDELRGVSGDNGLFVFRCEENIII